MMDEDFPDTQPLNPRPLVGVIAYVDVRSGKGRCENRSKAVAKQLDNLGATIAKRLTNDVTHIVYKDGHPGTLEHAKSHSCNLVSVLWVNACVSSNNIAPEGKYPAIFDENSDPVVLGKIKRIKSMQPKSLDEEEITRSVQKKRKVMKSKQILSEVRTPLQENEEHEVKENKTENEIQKPIIKPRRIKCSLVFTSCHRSDQETIHRVVQQLGGFTIVPSVDVTTSHIICGSVRRTYNILLGSVMGCWILPLEWVWRSLEAGKWLEEESYDMSKDFPAAKYFRDNKQGRYSFLQSIGPIFVATTNSLSVDQISNLLQHAGGEVTNCLRRAKMAVGTVAKDKEVVSVTLEWLLDSITAHKILPTARYTIKH
ncbi:microcephalin-like isoform X2 [Dysidea avara]|uniref:microcephalin-like isoform X2 n=1 Tax=Dysidea avara TaxID=196820 RepID=UPI00331D275F